MRLAALVTSVLLGLLAALLSTAGPAAAHPGPAVSGTTYTWTGGGDDTSWADGANWSPEGVPGVGDAAVVQAPEDAKCHAHVTAVPVGTEVADLTVDEHLYGGDPDSPCLTSIDGGSITVDHALVFHAGTIGSAVTVAAGATATVTPGAAHDTTHFSTGGVSVDGALVLAANTGVEYLSLTGGPGITVDAGGTVTAQGDNRLYADCCLNPAHVANHGTVQLGSGTLTLDSVELDQDALLTGTGGTVFTDFAPQTAGDGAQWTGQATWQMNHSSDITVSGTQALGPGVTWQLGGDGSTATETLHGTFSLSGTGTFDWAGGHIAAAMTIGKGVTVRASGPDTADPRRLSGHDGGAAVAVTNRGTVAFTGGAAWYGGATARFVNAAGATLSLGDGTAIGSDCCTAPSQIVNSGTVVVPGGTATIDSTSYVSNGGTTQIAAGATLALTGGATGSLTGATVTGRGTLAVAAPVTLSGTDTVDTGTTVALLEHGSLLTAARGSATLGGPGAFTWTGGTASGTVTVATAAGQTISGAATKDVAPVGSRPSSLTLAGPTTLAAGTAATPDTVNATGGSSVVFAGATTLRGNTRFAAGSFALQGATSVVAGNATTLFDAGTTLTDSGTLTVRTGTLQSADDLVQTAGSTSVLSGATVRLGSSSSRLRVRGGTLTGAGQVVGSVAVTGGTVAPGTNGVGTLAVTGDLTTTSASTLAVDVSATGADRLAVSGTASLQGTLRVTTVAGYHPGAGATATVVTGATVTAHFACTVEVGGAANRHWTAAVSGGTALVLTSRSGGPLAC